MKDHRANDSGAPRGQRLEWVTVKALEADKKASTAKEQVRLAKAKLKTAKRDFKAAKKHLKLVKKAAKKAGKEAASAQELLQILLDKIAQRKRRTRKRKPVLSTKTPPKNQPRPAKSSASRRAGRQSAEPSQKVPPAGKSRSDSTSRDTSNGDSTI
jgi:hypothetical protein